MGNRIPLLGLSDSPNSPTGLGRVMRELMQRTHDHLGETFKVGTYGLGGVMSSKLPWPQYQITSLQNWAPPDLPKIWDEFSEGQKGIIFTIWNPSSLVWLTQPQFLAKGTLKDFIETKPFSTWGYFPVDAEGPNGHLPEEVAGVISKFDRRLMYTRWSADMYDRTIGSDSVIATDDLPHGTDTHVFYPRDREESRKNFLPIVMGEGRAMPIRDDVFLIGVVATNSQRKNWGLCFRICQELLKRGINVGLWAHTNAPIKTWNIMAAAESFGMKHRVILTSTDLSDDKMAQAYSACDVTLGIGDGEGWGLPIFESLACGVPCIHGNYGGAAENLLPWYKIEPIGFYDEGLYCNRRPVFDPTEWADAVESVAGKKAELPKGLSWDECWPRWEEWILQGVNGD